MSFKDNWIPRRDGIDDADSSAVNEIAGAVIKNEENIEQIPNKYYTKTETNQNFANAIKGSASGEAIRLDDVSSLAHMLDVRVISENIIPYPYKSDSFEENGITATVNNDGSITLKGTAGMNTSFTIANKFSVPIAGEYTLFGGWHNEENQGQHVTVYAKTSIGQISSRDTSETIYLDNGVDIDQVAIWIPESADFGSDGITIYPQLKLGTDETYKPYVDVSKVKLKKYEKNIFDIDSLSYATSMGGGLISHAVQDKKITVTTDGSNLYTSAMYDFEYPIGIFGKSVTFSFDAAVSGSATKGLIALYFVYQNGDKQLLSTENTVIVPEYQDGCSLQLRVYCQNNQDGEGSITYSNIQLEIGKTATEYEEYKEPIEYIVNADGTVVGVKSVYPATTLLTDTTGVLIDVEYNRDLNAVFAELVKRIAALEVAVISQ